MLHYHFMGAEEIKLFHSYHLLESGLLDSDHFKLITKQKRCQHRLFYRGNRPNFDIFMDPLAKKQKQHLHFSLFFLDLNLLKP